MSHRISKITIQKDGGAIEDAVKNPNTANEKVNSL